MEVRLRNAEIQKQKEELRRKKKEDEEKLAEENRAMREQIKLGIELKANQTLQQKKNITKIIKTEKEVNWYNADIDSTGRK